jgi:hypothetical protein
MYQSLPTQVAPAKLLLAWEIEMLQPDRGLPMFQQLNQFLLLSGAAPISTECGHNDPAPQVMLTYVARQPRMGSVDRLHREPPYTARSISQQPLLDFCLAQCIYHRPVPLYNEV